MSDIYVLAIPEIRHDWVNDPANILRRIREMATPRGHSVVPISTLAQFQELVENPPRNAVVINAHGEAIPLPHQEEGNWLSFIRKVGMNVRNHGWIWTSITGYPFHYYGPETNRIPQPYMAGLATFLSVAEPEIEIIPIPGDLMRLTADGNRALEKIEVQISPQLRVGRGFFWRNVTPTSFFTSGTAHGACSVQIGEGFFVSCGIGANDLGHPNADQESDRRLADLSLAFTLAVCESNLEREFVGCENDENRFRENVIVPLLGEMDSLESALYIRENLGKTLCSTKSIILMRKNILLCKFLQERFIRMLGETKQATPEQ